MITENTTEEEILLLKQQYDLDKSVVYRYGKYMLNLVQGDLGRSLSGKSVWELYISRLPATLSLSLAALVIGVLLALPLGVFAARYAGTIWDNLTTAFTLIGMSMPSFWLGLLLLSWFSLRINIFPAGGNAGGFRSFVLPAVTVGLMLMAMVTRQTRSAMLEVFNADYLRTARGKGVKERVVIFKHAFKNASIPIITTIGNQLARTIAGAAVVESVYTWPGIGRLTIDAVQQRDTTLACGCVVLSAIIYVVLLLLVDLMYAFVDPRIRARYRGVDRRKKKGVMA